MALRNVFVISIVLLFLFSFASAVTVTDTPTDNTSAQNFASINARLVDLTNQVQSARVDDLNARANLLKKSDLQNVYDNMVNIGMHSIDGQIK